MCKTESMHSKPRVSKSRHPACVGRVHGESGRLPAYSRIPGHICPKKETIERVFADAKEKHGMRYTQLRGLERVKMQVTLTFACMNLKKLATWKRRKGMLPRISLPLKGWTQFLHQLRFVLRQKEALRFA